MAHASQSWPDSGVGFQADSLGNLRFFRLYDVLRCCLFARKRSGLGCFGLSTHAGKCTRVQIRFVFRYVRIRIEILVPDAQEQDEKSLSPRSTCAAGVASHLSVLHQCHHGRHLDGFISRSRPHLSGNSSGPGPFIDDGIQGYLDHKKAGLHRGSVCAEPGEMQGFWGAPPAECTIFCKMRGRFSLQS